MPTSFQYVISRIGEPQAAPKADTPLVCVDYWRDVIATAPTFDPEKEHLCAIFLNTRFTIKGFAVIAVGSLNEAIAHPREVFRPAIISAAYGFVLMHNHPAGDPSPSQADHALTRRLREGAELLQIRFLDHVIVGDRTPAHGFFSFKETGIL